MSRLTRAALLAISAVLMATGIQALGTVVAPAEGSADVCASVGRRISVNTCGNIADAVAPWVAPPAEFAPLPEDFQAAPPPPPPPPPPPNIGVCAGFGRRIHVSGCV